MNASDHVVEELIVWLGICGFIWLLGFFQQRVVDPKESLRVPHWLAIVCGSTTQDVGKGWFLIQLADAALFVAMVSMSLIVPPGRDAVFIMRDIALVLAVLTLAGRFILDRLH